MDYAQLAGVWSEITGTPIARGNVYGVMKRTERKTAQSN